MCLQGLVLWATGLYKGIWRFASFNDMWNIARAALFGSLLILLGLAALRGGQFSAWLPEVFAHLRAQKQVSGEWPEPGPATYRRND